MIHSKRLLYIVQKRWGYSSKCASACACSSHNRQAWLTQCKEKPKNDRYGFTYFARMMNEGKGVAPLASDSRRRPDRAALEVTATPALPYADCSLV